MFTTIFYQPIFNLVIFLYNIIPGNDIGLVIIVLSVIIKLATYPLSQKQIKSQKALQELQPEIEKIKAKHKDNKEEMSRAMLGLYKKHKFNPFSSCGAILIQMPFLIAVFHVFRNGFSQADLALVYSFIYQPEIVNMTTIGGLDLSKPNIYIAFVAAAIQYYQTSMLTTQKPEIKKPAAKDEDMTAMMNKQMKYMMPILTIVIGATLPGGVTLYWLVTSLFALLQQMIIFYKKKETNNKEIEGEIVK